MAFLVEMYFFKWIPFVRCSIFNFLFQVTERTPIKLNSPVYVSLDLDRPFKWNNIVLSLRSCFATDNPRSAFPTDNYYSLITGM